MNAVEIVLEVLMANGMDEMQARKTIFDMQKRGIELVANDYMLGIIREIG